MVARWLEPNLFVFGPSGFWTMAPLRCAAKFDPFLSLDCAPTPSTLAQTKERKGLNFASWQPCDSKQQDNSDWRGEIEELMDKICTGFDPLMFQMRRRKK